MNGFADSTRRSAIFAEQVIARQGVWRAERPKTGCSADQAYSHERRGAFLRSVFTGNMFLSTGETSS
jgi:hypothetical protein